jgi:hypothetical protein
MLVFAFGLVLSAMLFIKLGFRRRVGAANPGHGPRRVRSLPQMDDVVQIAKDDASDLARMGSDAG